MSAFDDLLFDFFQLFKDIRKDCFKRGVYRDRDGNEYPNFWFQGF